MKPDTYYAKLCKKETKPKFDQAATSDDDHERKKLRMEIDAFRRIVEEAKNGY